MKTLPNDDSSAVAKPASRGESAADLAPTTTALQPGSPTDHGRRNRELQGHRAAGAASIFGPSRSLFGRNSAGKSTILHALCYAHEILSHRNVDPRKVELAGDQVDLGGFQNLVHGHDLERLVRFRFELNLGHWFVPDRLLEKMARPELSESVDPGIAAALEDWVLVHARGELARTGWVEVRVGTRSGVPPDSHSL